MDTLPIGTKITPQPSVFWGGRKFSTCGLAPSPENIFPIFSPRIFRMIQDFAHEKFGSNIDALYIGIVDEKPHIF